MKQLVSGKLLIVLLGSVLTQEPFSQGMWIEVETIKAVSPWVLSTEKTGYSGTGYFFWTAGDNHDKSKGLLTYELNIPKDGRYIVSFRGRRDKEGSCAGLPDDYCNDIYTKMNNESWYKTMVKDKWGYWIWESSLAEAGSRSGTAKYDLKAGKNIFQICGRSRGVKIDLFTVHLEGTPRPTGPATSIRNQGQAQGTHSSLSMSGGTRIYNLHGQLIGTASAGKAIVGSKLGIVISALPGGRTAKMLNQITRSGGRI